MSDDAQNIFQKKSRSFSLAARLFSAGTRSDVARMYRFCRYVDDLADDSASGEPDKLMALARALEENNDPHDDAILNDFLDLAESRKLPRQAARELVAALIDDCGPRALATREELVRFAYGVAGTVGLLMCPLLGAHDRRAGAFAVDLGIALQLTNIARDIAEDAARRRFYLPAEWVTPDAIRLALEGLDAEAARQVDSAVARTLQLAERYYQSALRGHRFIPPRNRRAIFFALHFYRAIGNKMRQAGSGAWRTRTRLGLGEKITVGLRAYPEYRKRTRGEWAASATPEHDASLHRALEKAEP
jgi:phytoene synthase